AGRKQFGLGRVMNRMNGKVALVTGGGSGIGLAVAGAFLEEGARVVIVGRDEAKLRRAGESLSGGERLLPLATDVSKPEEVQAMIRYVAERWGGVDVLVNNAGVNVKERTVRELTPETWQRLLRANLDGAFYCIHAVLPHM